MKLDPYPCQLWEDFPIPSDSIHQVQNMNIYKHIVDERYYKKIK